VVKAKVAVVEWVENERTSTVMRLMFHLNSALPSKIPFDIDAHYFDKKIKICIIL
jgi:hypothetical protein